MAEIDARIPLMYDTSNIYDPNKAQAEAIALKKGQQDLQRGEFEQKMQPYKEQEAKDSQQLNALKVAAEKNDYALKLLDAAQNPQQWQSVRAHAIESGIAAPNEIPEIYSPGYIQKARMAHMSFKDRLSYQLQNAELAIRSEDLKLRREDRREDRETDREYKRDYLDILRAKAGQAVDPDTGQIIAAPAMKNLPTGQQTALLENLQNFRRANTALTLIGGGEVGSARGDPEATGLKGYLPEGLLQRADSKGVDTRAAIADLGSLIIHDRSGAAVTASEYPRLKPFIPKETDSPGVAKQKLKRFTEIYRDNIKEQLEVAQAQGYRVPEINLGESTEAGAAPAPAPGSRIKWSDF